MNINFLNTPNGTEEFVEADLDRKLQVLKYNIDVIAEIPFKMEAFTILRTASPNAELYI